MLPHIGISNLATLQLQKDGLEDRWESPCGYKQCALQACWNSRYFSELGIHNTAHSPTKEESIEALDKALIFLLFYEKNFKKKLAYASVHWHMHCLCFCDLLSSLRTKVWYTSLYVPKIQYQILSNLLIFTAKHLSWDVGLKPLNQCMSQTFTQTNKIM